MDAVLGAASFSPYNRGVMTSFVDQKGINYQRSWALSELAQQIATSSRDNSWQPVK